MLNQLEVRRPSSKPPLQCPKVATKGQELLTNHPRESDIPPAKRTPPPSRDHNHYRFSSCQGHYSLIEVHRTAGYHGC